MNPFLLRRERLIRLFVLGLFVLGIAVCVIANISLLRALGFGLVCFSLHARSTGIAWPEILRLLFAGAGRVFNLLAIFLLIGMLTGVWRISGTIPLLIDKALSFIEPDFFFLWCFLLCAGLSTLLGTSFGTVSTLGVICMLMARAAGIDEVLAGGAILSGVYVGDRCSPMSSSAALVCAITGTELYANLRAMFRSGLIPLLLTSAGYALLSLLAPAHNVDASSASLLREEFRSGVLVLLPALSVIVLGVLRVEVKLSMLVSILLAAAAGVFIQHVPPEALLTALVSGYAAPRPELGFLSGGGIASMSRVIGIVMLSSSYSLLIQRSRLLDDFSRIICVLSQRLGPYPATAVTSVCTAALACNQTLAILLTQQLCAPVQTDRQSLALYLEDSVVLISALLPWNIAFSIVALTLQQGESIIPFALYLWLLPLCQCVKSFAARRRTLAKNPRRA